MTVASTMDVVVPQRNGRCPGRRRGSQLRSPRCRGDMDMKRFAVLGIACALGSVAIVERAVQARRSAVEAAPTSTPAIARSASSVVSPTSRPITATAVFERNDGQAAAPYRYLARHVEHEFAFAPGAIAITVTDGAGSSSVALRFDGGRAAEPAAEAPL